MTADSSQSPENSAKDEPAAGNPIAGPAKGQIYAALVLAILAGATVAAVGEWTRFADPETRPKTASEWFIGVNPQTTIFVPLFALLPLFWLVRRPLFTRRARPATNGGGQAANRSLAQAWVFAAIVAASAGGMSWGIGQLFGDIPPAYHDEYSYLFQAKTYLAGRLANPVHETAPELFDQMHVLNEDHFVSRYFPGAGAWMAPFVKLGHPYWGHWLANAITAFFVFWAGRELGGNGVGLLAGLLTALSPGMALFSNLLLAHLPTLVG